MVDEKQHQARLLAVLASLDETRGCPAKVDLHNCWENPSQYPCGVWAGFQTMEQALARRWRAWGMALAKTKNTKETGLSLKK